MRSQGCWKLWALRHHVKSMRLRHIRDIKAPFVIEIITFLSRLFGYVEKRLNNKVKVNSKFFDVLKKSRDNYDTHIVQYLKK